MISRIKCMPLFASEMTVFLCLKAALTEQSLMDLTFKFNIATATYLTQLATHSDLTQFSEVTFPLGNRVSPALSCMPEFVAENVIDYMLFLRHFRESMFESVGEKTEHLMTYILVFMGSPDRMLNPHLRAKMAEALDALLPPQDGAQRSLLMSQ